MIKTLLENEGVVSVRRIAETFLAKDKSQIESFPEPYVNNLSQSISYELTSTIYDSQ